jgi:hypothetical protein
VPYTILQSTIDHATLQLEDCTLHIPTPLPDVAPRFPFTLEKFFVENQPTHSAFPKFPAFTHRPLPQSLLPPASSSILRHLGLVGHAAHGFIDLLAQDFLPFTNLQTLRIEAASATHPQFIRFISGRTILKEVTLDSPAILDIPYVGFDNSFPVMGSAVPSASLPLLNRYDGPDYNVVYFLGERPIRDLCLWGTDGSWAFSSDPNELLELLNSLDQRHVDVIEALDIRVTFATRELFVGICEKFGGLKNLTITIREERDDLQSTDPGEHFEDGLASIEVSFCSFNVSSALIFFNRNYYSPFPSLRGHQECVTFPFSQRCPQPGLHLVTVWNLERPSEPQRGR